MVVLTYPFYLLLLPFKFALLTSLKPNKQPNNKQQNMHRQTKAQPNKKTTESAENITRSKHVQSQGARTSGESVCSKYKEVYGKILNSLTIVKLYRGMSKLNFEINVRLPKLSCIVVSVALNGEFKRLGGFRFDCYYYVIRRRQGWKAHFRPLQREADFHPEIRIARLPNRTPDKLKG